MTTNETWPEHDLFKLNTLTPSNQRLSHWKQNPSSDVATREPISGSRSESKTDFPGIETNQSAILGQSGILVKKRKKQEAKIWVRKVKIMVSCLKLHLSGRLTEAAKPSYCQHQARKIGKKTCYDAIKQIAQHSGFKRQIVHKNFVRHHFS